MRLGETVFDVDNDGVSDCVLVALDVCETLRVGVTELVALSLLDCDGLCEGEIDGDCDPDWLGEVV